jgi:hypothetical protein
MAEPIIRIIHNLARSGGTLISKCIGCMSDIVLLSEIQPDGFDVDLTQCNKPLVQAVRWHNIVPPNDMKEKLYNIIEAIDYIERECVYRNKKLVIRDLAHIDFMGLPIIKPPSLKFRLAQILSNHFNVLRLALVRHPIDQWLSMKKVLPDSIMISLENYLRGYLEYSRQIKEIAFIRYEDFTRNPKKEMQIICDRLRLKVDWNFLTKWSIYDKISGDEDRIRSRRPALKEIVSLPRLRVEDKLLGQFRANKHYWEALKILDYKDE